MLIKSIATAVMQLCAVTEVPEDCEWYMLECLNIEKAECTLEQQQCSDDVLSEICIEGYVESWID